MGKVLGRIGKAHGLFLRGARAREGAARLMIVGRPPVLHGRRAHARKRLSELPQRAAAG